MSLDTTFVGGLDELDAVLASLTQKEATSLKRRALRRAGKPMVAAAKRLVPYDIDDPDGPDGFHLRDHIDITVEPKRTRVTETDFRIGVRRRQAVDDPNGYAIDGGLSKSDKSPIYDQIVEADTPFLRPAFDETVSGVITEYRGLLEKGIERIVKKRQRAAT